MNAIVNSLTPEQVEFIINAYGTVENWIIQGASIASIAIEDVMM